MSPGLRWSRSIALATLASGGGVIAHTAGGGIAPAGPFLTVLTLLVAAGSYPLLARPASAARIVAMTIGGQFFIHLTLMVSTGHGASVSSAPIPGPKQAGSGHAMHGAAALSAPQAGVRAGPPEAMGAPGMSLTDHVIVMFGPHALPMTLCHLAAAAAVGLWLAWGERSLLRLFTLAWRRLVAPEARLIVLLRRPAVAPTVALPTLSLMCLSQAVSRRGPPNR